MSNKSKLDTHFYKYLKLSKEEKELLKFYREWKKQAIKDLRKRILR